MAELVHVHKCMNMNRHALVWPRPSHILTFVPRRPPHRLSSKAGYKSWRHPLAPKLPTSQNHIPAPNQGIAVRTDDAQVASPVSKESLRRSQRDLRLPHQNQTYHGPGLPLELSARLLRETCRWSCTLSADRRYVPADGAGDISTVCTTDLLPTVRFNLTFLREL